MEFARRKLAMTLLAVSLYLPLRVFSQTNSTTANSTSTFATSVNSSSFNQSSFLALAPVEQMCDVIQDMSFGNVLMHSYFDANKSFCYVVPDGSNRDTYNTTVEKCAMLADSGDGNWTCRVPQIDDPQLFNIFPDTMREAYYFIALRRNDCNSSWVWDSGANTTSPYEGNLTTVDSGETCRFTNYVISATGATPTETNYSAPALCECATQFTNSALRHSNYSILHSVLLLVVVYLLTPQRR